MKNIQVIDGADNCVYDIFQVSDAGYRLIFGPGEDVAFIDEVVKKRRGKAAQLKSVFASMWKRRVAKRKAHGIHGLLFYELPGKKVYYPTRRDEDARNPGGSKLR
ncbi:MAG TPA: hypothetical protein VKC60_15755 [Opitutaceae bacterium]|nr:hypothetical protein [Opitutaceae bacterium]